MYSDNVVFENLKNNDIFFDYFMRSFNRQNIDFYTSTKKLTRDRHIRTHLVGLIIFLFKMNLYKKISEKFHFYMKNKGFFDLIV